MYPSEPEKPSLLLNKKFLIFVAILIIIGLIVFFITKANNIAIEDEDIETDSIIYDEYLYETENFAIENHPISEILPIINEDPKYVINYISSLNLDGSFSFVLTIEYADYSALSAARVRLSSSEFSAYEVSDYEIIETQIAD